MDDVTFVHNGDEIMVIDNQDFFPGRGVVFTLRAQSDAERVILWAISQGKGLSGSVSGDDNELEISFLVSN